MHRKEALILDILANGNYEMLPKALGDKDIKEWLDNLNDGGYITEEEYDSVKDNTDKAALWIESAIKYGKISHEAASLTVPSSVRELVSRAVKVYAPPKPKVSNLLKDLETIRKSLFGQLKVEVPGEAPPTPPEKEMAEKGYLIDVITGEKILPSDIVLNLPEGPAKKENWERAVQLRKELREKHPDIFYSWHDIFEMVRKEKSPP